MSSILVEATSKLQLPQMTFKKGKGVFKFFSFFIKKDLKSYGYEIIEFQ